MFHGLTWFSSCLNQSPELLSVRVCFWNLLRGLFQHLNSLRQTYSLNLCRLLYVSSLINFHSMITYHMSIFVGYIVVQSVASVCCVRWSHSAVKVPQPFGLQPLICVSHEGGTSVKDVVGLSTFKLDICFN